MGQFGPKSTRSEVNSVPMVNRWEAETNMKRDECAPIFGWVSLMPSIASHLFLYSTMFVSLLKITKSVLGNKNTTEKQCSNVSLLLTRVLFYLWH